MKKKVSKAIKIFIILVTMISIEFFIINDVILATDNPNNEESSISVNKNENGVFINYNDAKEIEPKMESTVEAESEESNKLKTVIEQEKEDNIRDEIQKKFKIEQEREEKQAEEKLEMQEEEQEENQENVKEEKQEEDKAEKQEQAILSDNKRVIKDGKYVIKSVINENYVLDIYDNSTVSGANLEIWRSNQGENQKFNVKYLGNGEYSIFASHSNKSLDVEENGKKSGTNVIQWASNNQDNQKWIIKAVGDGSYKIISKANNLCLDIPYGDVKSGANVQVWVENGGKNQMFKFEKVDEKEEPTQEPEQEKEKEPEQETTVITGTKTITNGMYNIKSLVSNNSVLDIAERSMENGGNLIVWNNNLGMNQKFNIKYLNDGSYAISAVHSGKSIDVEGALKTSGTNVIQWSYHGNDNQRWIIKKISDGNYNIISKDSGLYLTDEDGNVCIKEADNSNAQKFNFEETTLISIDETRYPGYKEKLENLQKAHPNWNFELLYTGLNFEDVTSGECKVHSRNLVPSSYSGEWVCPVCGTKLYDSGLYCASEKTVAYYMDPRNFLDDTNIFQFEKLNVYESSIHTIQGIRNKVDGTFLDNYADDINTACRNQNVNPYYIVARLLQEQGRKGSKIGTGMDGGNGKTYYNPFNIGASGNGYSQIYNNALKKAKSYGWDTMEKALEGGIEFLKRNWLENYQNTLYQNKFDIDTRNGTSLYTHQYMQHIMGAYSEAKTLRSMYNQIDCLDGYFTFIIPVYENMSSSPYQMPTNNSESSSINVKVTANGGLRLRSDANTSSSTIEVIPNGTVVLSVQRGINDNWNKVITSDGKIGFMSGNYLQIIDTIKNCNYTANVKTNDGSGCKVRVGPSTNLDRITSLSEGTLVTIIEKGTYNDINGYDWCRVITPDGRQGYMPLRYLN